MEVPGMYYLERHCEWDSEALHDCGVKVHEMAQDIALFASVPLSTEGWQALGENQLIIAQSGRIVSTVDLS
jgi:hypothetical protein